MRLKMLHNNECVRAIMKWTPNQQKYHPHGSKHILFGIEIDLLRHMQAERTFIRNGFDFIF